jgi:4-carboxymuconolactone decarboxylase
MTRLAPIVPANFTEAQQTLFDSITQGKRGVGRTPDSFLGDDGGMGGPFNAMLTSPGFGQVVQRMGEVIRFENPAPPQLREMAILIVAAKWEADYEWWAHEKIALKEGLDPDIIAAIKAGTEPNFSDAAQAVVYHFAQELLTTQNVSDQRYQEAVGLIGESGIFELVTLLGFYTIISMSLKAFQVPLPAGEKSPFASGAP